MAPAHLLCFQNKLHVELNHNGYHSPFAAITEGKTSHVTTMKFYTQYSACHLFSIVFVALAMATENICSLSNSLMSIENLYC